jgi:hypothetical protein
MPRFASPLAGLLLLLAWACTSPASRAQAAEPLNPDPVHIVPEAARVVVVVDHPRKLVETITRLDAVEQLQTLAPVRQAYDSAAARNLLQLLAHAEKQLGAKWPDLLDQLAGNGLVLTLQVGLDPPPALAIAAGKDPAQVAKAFDLAISMFEEESARQGSKDRFQVREEKGMKFAHLGNAVHLARVGATILVANDVAYLKEAVGRANSVHSGVPKARRDAARLLPEKPLAWAWVNFAAYKETKSARDFYDSTRQDFFQTMLGGSTIDCLRRSDFVTLGLYREANGLRLKLRLPAGRDGMWSDLLVHVPPKGQPGSLPFLEPPGTIYSQSFYLDLGYVWKHRDRLIITADIRQGLEGAEKQLSRVLPSNVRIGDLIQMWGPHHRIVVANHDRRPYKTEPSYKLPAFGYVGTMTDRRFAANIDSSIRAAGLFGSLAFGLKTIEVQHEGVAITGFRLPEDKPFPGGDAEGIRFNFEPCFAVVGDELMLASTIELGKKLVTELKNPRGTPSTAVWRGRAAARNAAEAIRQLSDPFVTDAILTRGVSLKEANEEVAAIIEWIRTLGTVDIELDITDSEYRLDLSWKPGK